MYLYIAGVRLFICTCTCTCTLYVHEHMQEMERLKAELDVINSDLQRMTERLNMEEGSQQPPTASVSLESEVQAVVPSGSPLSTYSTASSSRSSQVYAHNTFCVLCRATLPNIGIKERIFISEVPRFCNAHKTGTVNGVLI